MSITKSLLYYLLCVSCIILLTSHPGYPSSGVPEITVHSNNPHSMFSGIVEEQAQNSYNQLSKYLEYEVNHPIQIYLTDTIEQFNELTAGTLPDWSAAVAIGTDQIVLTPLEGHKHDLTHIITHEMAHILLNSASSDQSIPRWFHEGVAEMYSGTIGIRGRFYLMWKVHRNELLSFYDIQHIFSSGKTDATLAYDESMLAVKFLVLRNGRDIVPSIIDRLESGHNFDQAFVAETGIDQNDYEHEYLQYLLENYTIGSLIGFIPNTWTVILILAFLAYIVTKLRSRRIIRRWETEDSHGLNNHLFDEDDLFN